MKITSTHQNLYIGLEDEYGKVINEQILVVSASGQGKTLFTEGMAEEYHKKGYIVCILDTDPKGKIEQGFQMFEPEEKYHLNHLRKIGKIPSSKKVKLYHAYTQNLPKENLPEMNLFTFSLKDLGRTEYGLIAETDSDKEVIRLMVQASQDISKEDGVYGYLHHVQDMVKGKGNDGKKANWNNFGLEGTSGTMKSITEISSHFKSFQNDPFLAKDNCPLNINWKQILNDQEHYHYFFSKWIRDEKLRDFIILALLEGILRNSDVLKKPLLIIIPEIRRLCSFHPEGHKVFLSNSIKNALSLLRNSGRGISSILDAQVYTDISKDIRDSSTQTFLGQLGGGDDLDKVCKLYSYKREIKEKLKNMPYRNCFLLVGKEDEDVFTGFFSSSGHAEPHYNFIEMYKKKGFPMKNYSDTHKMMKKMMKDEEDKFRDKIKKREKAEKERKEKQKAEKEAMKSEYGKVDKKIERAEKKIEETDIMKGKMINQLKKQNPKISKRKICQKLDIPEGSKGMINKWEKNYLNSLETTVPGLEPINLELEDGYSEE